MAISTPPGKSAVALIRISGASAYLTVKKMSKNMPKKQNIATFNEILSHEGLIIDQTITTFFKAPKSFTGDDVVEISTHGSSAVIKKLMQTFLKSKDIRLAKPGEFTRRAFENNKLDLTQVEAIADIVSAETEAQRKQAVGSLSGHLSQSTKSIFEDLKKILANIEAIIDFSEEELPENLMISIKEQIKNTIKNIKKITKNASLGISIRDGFLVALLGKPNTGKSSFINNVSGRDIAIVTDIPGTTRDVLESFVDVGGYPIKFLDTAGIRKSSNLVEKMGIEKAYLASKKSNLTLVFINEKIEISEYSNIKNSLFVMSKQDITKKDFFGSGYYNISSKDGYGIDLILKIIKENINKNQSNEQIFISRERQLTCLLDTIFHLENTDKEKSVDLFAEDIRLSLKSLSSLFGNIDIEDVLDIIFSDFCIGK